MLCIINNSTDPWFNLAAEDYLLHNFTVDCFMLWRNERTIVVGKHQNTLAEINMDHVREKGIGVARRLSGGGAVYHDLGNLNFTFIVNGKEGKLVDFKRFTLPVQEVLRKLGVDAEFTGKNNLTIKGRKISGNAEHVYRKRVLHHGTLLFSSEMDELSMALRVNPLKYRSKAVKSIRSRVTNIKDHLDIDMNVVQFRDLILDHIMKTRHDSMVYEFSDNDLASIEKLRTDKYNTWEWNFGYSPDYDFEKSVVTNGGVVRICLNVSGGIIRKANIYSDQPAGADLYVLEGILEGARHEKGELRRRLKPVALNNYIENITPDDFIRGMF
ncbi:MAG: lipoate--protein ligase [Marinilabiliales bacterium]|nr:MAG: lipoate--protein ligase [Marinilabiliales bacterium]